MIGTHCYVDQRPIAEGQANFMPQRTVTVR